MTIRVTVSEARPSGYKIRAFAMEYQPQQSQAKSLRELHDLLEEFMRKQEAQA